MAKNGNDKIRIKTAKKVYSVILVFAIIWCLSALAAPLFISYGGVISKLSLFTYSFFSTTCHQEEARSFIITGNQVAVCSRCLVIYLSFTLGTIVYPFVRNLGKTQMPPLWILLSAAGIMFLDAVAGLIGFYENSFLTRSITGGLLGFVLPFYIIPGLINFIYEVKSFLKDEKTDAATTK